MQTARRTFLTTGTAATILAAASPVLAQWQPSQRYPDPSVQVVDQNTQGALGG